MSIHKRTAQSGNVSWVVRFRDPIPRERTFRLKGDAERFERRIIREMETGEYHDPPAKKLTFEQWHERWWPTIETSDRAPSTITGYESSLRIQVLPYLGDVPIKDLRKIHMEEWLGKLRKAGYSSSTIHIAKTAAGMVLTSAVDSGIITANPMTGLRIAKGTSKTRQALTAEQVELLADSVGSWWRPFVLVLAYCGLRPGEAIGLCRRHLDDLGRLTIEGAVTEHKGQLVEGDTKTHRSRLVQVPESVLMELKEYMRVHVADDSQAQIFSAPDGSMVRLSNWRHRIWQPAVQQAGLPPGVTPYVLRHTAASLMAQQGVPVSTAAAALGHDPAIYLRTYAHLYPGDLRSAADAMDSARTAARKGTTTAPAGITWNQKAKGRADSCGVVHPPNTSESRGDSAGMGFSERSPEAPASA
jgi:integrase